MPGWSMSFSAYRCCACTQSDRLYVLRRFYTDAYDLFVIGIAKPMIAVVYFPQLNGKLAKTDDLWITGVALVGTLCGQVKPLKTAISFH